MSCIDISGALRIVPYQECVFYFCVLFCLTILFSCLCTRETTSYFLPWEMADASQNIPIESPEAVALVCSPLLLGPQNTRCVVFYSLSSPLSKSRCTHIRCLLVDGSVRGPVLCHCSRKSSSLNGAVSDCQHSYRVGGWGGNLTNTDPLGWWTLLNTCSNSIANEISLQTALFLAKMLSK